MLKWQNQNLKMTQYVGFLVAMIQIWSRFLFSNMLLVLLWLPVHFYWHGLIISAVAGFPVPLTPLSYVIPSSFAVNSAGLLPVKRWHGDL